MIFHGRTPVTEVILHTSATPTGWANGKTAQDVVEEFDRWHKDRGWSGIGYHRIFMPSGEMGVGRSLWDTGAHVRGHNTGTIGICLIPEVFVDTIGRFSDFYTKQQEIALREYMRSLLEYTDIQKVSGHNDYAAKNCPCFKVKTSDWL
jgi:hypothetical protein